MSRTPSDEPAQYEDGDRPPEASALLASLDRLAGCRCRDCGAGCCGHEALFSIALGFSNSPRCLDCLARGLERNREELRQQLTEYLRRKDCYWQAWQAACERERQPLSIEPTCLANQGSAPPRPTHRIAEQVESDMDALEQTFDAGEMGCGELALELRKRLAPLAPGTPLRVIARDPAAPVDLPAWCRLTGHLLAEADHPHYLIRRKET